MMRPVSSASFCSAQARTIGAAAVRGDHQAGHRGITISPHPIEPAPNAVDGELPGIVIDPQADIAEVGADVVDPVRDYLAQFLVLEIMGIDLDRLALWPVVAAAVLEFADQFLLLRVDRYHGLIGRLKRFDLGVDIFKLSVAIGMFAALLGLAVEMAAIFQFPQQLGNTRRTDLVAHRAKRRRQPSPACRGSWRPIATAASDRPSSRARAIVASPPAASGLWSSIQGCPRPCAAPFPPAKRGLASPSARARSCFGRPSSRATTPRSRHSPLPLPPQPRSDVGLSRPAKIEPSHTGYVEVIRQTSSRYKGWPRPRESPKQSEPVK